MSTETCDPPYIIPIDCADDPRIADFLDVRERDLVGRRDGFVAEGEVVLQVLLTRSPYAAESILVSERRLAALLPLLRQAPPDVPIHVAPQALMERIVGFPIHRGVLAIGRRQEAPEARALLAGLGSRALVVAAIGVSNHDNVGGIFRNAAAFGADAVLIDGATCDPMYRKAIRVSVGGTLIVPFTRVADASDLVAHLDDASFDLVGLSPTGAETLASLTRRNRQALLLGAEGPGLPEAILRRTRTVRIPMAGAFDSLNVATAGAIALHHFADTQGRDLRLPSGGLAPTAGGSPPGPYQNAD